MSFTYYKITCPTCKNVITKGFQHTSETGHLEWGSPIDICPHCKTPYLTGKEYRSIMSSSDQWMTLVGQWFIWGYTKIAYLGIGGVFIWVFFFQDSGDQSWLAFYVLLCIGFLVYSGIQKQKVIVKFKQWKPENNLIELYSAYLKTNKNKSSGGA